MNKAKLILLYGFASSGKTTLSKKYIDAHPLSISIEGDQIISTMGQWRKYEDDAREIVFGDTKSITKNHLQRGHNVLLPYLLTNPAHAEVFEDIAKETSADFCEVYINIEREDAINRLLDRGVWGEEGSPQLTKKDLPEINNLYDVMEDAMRSRDGVKTISSDFGDIEGAYSKLINTIS